MKTLLNFALIVLASFSLVACSYFNDDDEMSLDTTPPAAETIDLTRNSTDVPPMTGSDTIQPQRFEPPPNIQDVINNSSKGSVQMYSPDAPPPLQQAQGRTPAETYSFGAGGFKPADTVSAVPVDRPSSSMISMDPSVEVFSLDGPVQGSGVGMTVVNAATGDEAVIYFGRSETTLDAEDSAKILSLATSHNIAQGIAVEGFASTESTIQDPVQRKIANLKVSMERAFSAAKALIEKGVPAELITAVGYGETRPGSNPGASRRVEIHGLSGH